MVLYSSLGDNGFWNSLFQGSHDLMLIPSANRRVYLSLLLSSSPTISFYDTIANCHHDIWRDDLPYIPVIKRDQIRLVFSNIAAAIRDNTRCPEYQNPGIRGQAPGERAAGAVPERGRGGE